MQRVPDPYRVLGVGRQATVAEVRAAHRRLAKRYHPDAPNADAIRFLAVQHAYELLRDPLRRRDWDRRHAPGPVRPEPPSPSPRRREGTSAEAAADAGPTAQRGPARSGSRSRGAGPSDAQHSSAQGPRSEPSGGRRRARPAGADATFGPNDRPPDADHWTWSAEGVPWWEDRGSPRTRRARGQAAGRTPGQGPAAGAATGGPGAAAAGARRGRETGPPDAGTPHDPRPGRDAGPQQGAPARPAAAGRRRARPIEPGVGERSEFDVFSRSSGAAWSSASRAYFRRRGADMPTGAADPDTPRWTTPLGAPPPRRYEPATSRPAPTAPRPDPEARRAGSTSPRLGAALAALFRRKAAADRDRERR